MKKYLAKSKLKSAHSRDLPVRHSCLRTVEPAEVVDQMALS